MTVPGLPILSEHTPAITVCGRSLPRFLGAVIRNPLDALPVECYRDPVVFARLAGRPRLYLTDPALIHEAYVRQADHLEKGPIFRRVLGAALGDGILTADGEHWRAQRAAAAPAEPVTNISRPDLRRSDERVAIAGWLRIPSRAGAPH